MSVCVRVKEELRNLRAAEDEAGSGQAGGARGKCELCDFLGVGNPGFHYRGFGPPLPENVHF